MSVLPSHLIPGMSLYLSAYVDTESAGVTEEKGDAVVLHKYFLRFELLVALCIMQETTYENFESTPR